MKVKETELRITTKSELQVLDITEDVQRVVSKTGIRNGIVNVFVPASTGAVTTMEYEPGLLRDLPNALERLAPRNANYEHEKIHYDETCYRTGSRNGHSHTRASIIGPSMTVPLSNGSLRLGTWQQLVFVELDIRPRTRSLIITCIGE